VEGDHAPLLSSTTQDAPSDPIVLYVWDSEREPGLPTFCVTLCVAPSPKVNFAPLIYPSGSLPEQVNVIVCGVPTAEVMFADKLLQVGVVLPDEGIGVLVGVAVFPGIGVGVSVLVTVGETDAPVALYVPLLSLPTISEASDF